MSDRDLPLFSRYGNAGEVGAPYREAIFCDRARAGQFRVDEKGRIWRTVKGGECRAESRTRLGYLQVRFAHDGRRHYFSAHRCVWAWLNGSIDPAITINHINGVKDDNRPENLELATRGENQRHAYATGLRPIRRENQPTQDLRRSVHKVTATNDKNIRSAVRRFTGLMSAEERFTEKTKALPSGCVEWTGAVIPNGYGHFTRQGRATVLAHRFAYELRHGAVPDGLVIDHLCGNRRCVNADHLEAVTTRENLLRGTSPVARNASATHCIHGHEFAPLNTYVSTSGHRTCKACTRRRDRERKSRLRSNSLSHQCVPVPDEVPA